MLGWFKRQVVWWECIDCGHAYWDSYSLKNPLPDNIERNRGLLCQGCKKFVPYVRSTMDEVKKERLRLERQGKEIPDWIKDYKSIVPIKDKEPNRIKHRSMFRHRFSKKVKV